MAIIKWFGWLTLAILCASAVASRVEGGWAWLWVFAAFYAPWGLRAAIRRERHEAGNQRFWSFIILLCLLALFTSGCATAEREAARKAKFDAEWAANFTDRKVTIHSAPSGAIVDLNGDVIGTTPFVYDLKRCYRGSWPANGHIIQVLRARWLDGMALLEPFPTTSTPPETVLFMHPHATQYMQSAAAPTISQR